MTTRRASTRILALSRLLENLAELYPATCEHLDRQLTDLDGWPTRGNDNLNVTSSRPSSTTERSAEARLRHSQIVNDLDAGITLLAVTTRDLIDTCHHELRNRTINAHLHPTKRCDLHGREGATEWGDPLCGDYATKGPLCGRCWWREYRWRKAHGLPNRSDTADVA